MPEVDINDIAGKGVARDEPAYQLPPELWTQALNMRHKDNAMVRMDGWSQVFGTPTVAPHFAIPVVSPTAVFWLYVSLAKGYVYDGANHTDITRAAGGDYTATNTRDWNGTIFGGIPILNNGADVPQMWPTLSIGTDLTALSNWPATYRAKILRSLGAYLFAFNITKGTDIYPHLVKWSSEATQPGSVPGSWDETNDAVDTGEYDLYDVNSGVILDALPLAGKMYTYKEQSTWVTRFVGGRAVFSFDTFLETSGILAPRCVAVTGDGKNQIVATQDDLIIHNGGNPASILDKRLRREVFNSIDTTNYLNSFIGIDPDYNEAVFCYPSTGATNPDKAVVFNYKSGTVTEMDGVTFRNMVTGRIQTASGELWSDGSDAWAEDTGPWDIQERRRTILCGTDDTKFFKLHDGTTRNGVSFTGTLQRTGLSVEGKKRDGSWIVNHETKKMLDRIWPKIKNGSVSIRFSAQETVDGPAVWTTPVAFDPTAQVFCDVDPPIEGRAVGLEISAANDFRLDGYRLNVTPLGNY
jgi:hypothetical protein